MDEGEQAGRCITCGFLAKLDAHFDGLPPYFYEVPPKDRDTGRISPIRVDATREIHVFVHCYVNAADLWNELTDVRIKHGHGPAGYEATKHFLGENRQCIKWHPYTQGFTPQEHLEEVRMLELEFKREQFETEMERKRQEFEQRMATDQRALMQKIDSSNRSMQLWLTFILGGIAVLEIIVGLLQVVYPTGFPWLQKILGVTTP